MMKGIVIWFVVVPVLFIALGVCIVLGWISAFKRWLR